MYHRIVCVTPSVTVVICYTGAVASDLIIAILNVISLGIENLSDFPVLARSQVNWNVASFRRAGPIVVNGLALPGNVIARTDIPRIPGATVVTVLIAPTI